MRLVLLGTFPVRSFFESQLEFTTAASLEHPSSPLVNLTRQLAQEKEIDLHVVTLHPHLKRDYVLQMGGVSYHLLRGGRLSLQILTLYQLDKRRLHSMLNRLRPDVIQAFGTEGPYAYAAIASRYPSIIYMQGIVHELIKSMPFGFNLNWLRMFITQFVESNVVKKGRNFIVESSFSKQFVRAKNPLAKIHAMKNLINPLYFQVERKPASTLHSIEFVGRVTASKGVFELLHALAEIYQEYPDINLEFIGPIHDPREDAKIKALVDELDLSRRVSFAGLQPAEYIAERLADALMMVYPSYMDTSPNSVYEAMASGVPVISTQVGGIPDMISDTVDGILVPARDHRSLANAMRLLLDHPEQNLRIGQNAKRATYKLLDPAIAIQNLKHVYYSLLGVSPVI